MRNDKKTLAAADCPNLTRLYSEIFDKLKSMIDIRSTVALDFTAIREKFPCNGYAYDFLNRFVSNFNLKRFYFIEECILFWNFVMNFISLN